MEQLFSGKVYEILPTQDGIIFSYLNKEYEDGKAGISYKMISFDTRRITDVAKNIYMINKFGNSYKAVERFCENYVTVKSIILPGSKVFMLHEDGKAQLIDADGESLWTGSLVYRNNIPSDILLFSDGLWVVYEKGNVMVKYSLETMREELRIGGSGNSPFNGPCDLFEENGNVIVCNKNSQKIIIIDLDKYNTLEYETFEEPLLQYVSVKGYRFVNLESGLYVI